MMCKPGRRSGFTILEAILALTIGTVILGIVVQMLMFAVRRFQSADDRLQTREVVNLSLTTLDAALRDAQRYRIENAGATLRFLNAAGEGELRYDNERGQ